MSSEVVALVMAGWAFIVKGGAKWPPASPTGLDGWVVGTAWAVPGVAEDRLRASATAAAISRLFTLK